MELKFVTKMLLTWFQNIQLKIVKSVLVRFEIRKIKVFKVSFCIQYLSSSSSKLLI